MNLTSIQVSTDGKTFKEFMVDPTEIKGGNIPESELPKWYVAPTLDELCKVVCKEVLGHEVNETEMELFQIVMSPDMTGFVYRNEIIGQIVAHSDHFSFYPNNNIIEYGK